jgi:hypothetical protein
MFLLPLDFGLGLWRLHTMAVQVEKEKKKKKKKKKIRPTGSHSCRYLNTCIILFI